MIDVGRWLDEIGLPQYAAVFAAEAIDAGVLPTLTDVELRDLGLPLGHRKRLLAAIAALDTAPPELDRAIGSARQPTAEQRHLTVMFCDLIDFDPACRRARPGITARGDQHLPGDGVPVGRRL